MRYLMLLHKLLPRVAGSTADRRIRIYASANAYLNCKKAPGYFHASGRTVLHRRYVGEYLFLLD